MFEMFRIYHFLVSLSVTMAIKDDLDLPLCPPSLQYLPQQLPMHCRLPRSAPQYPSMLPGPLMGMSPGMPSPMPAPMPPGMAPDMPPGMPQALAPVIPPGMPPGMSPGMPMPMPMPITMPGGPPHKMPVIVMPFYSPDRKSNKRPSHYGKHHHKKQYYKKPHHLDSREPWSDDDSDTDSDSSRERGWWKPPYKNKDYGVNRRFNRRHFMRKQKKKSELVTPILQYVTKDGYVIFEKKITKNEADNWLGPQEHDKAHEELKFKKNLEPDEPEVEPEPPKQTPIIKQNKEISVEEKETNESEELPPQNSQQKQRPRFGSILGRGP